MLLDAAMQGNLDMFEFLLDSCGVDPASRDMFGKNVQEYIKNDYGGKGDLTEKTQVVKDKMLQLLYRKTLSKPFKQGNTTAVT